MADDDFPISADPSKYVTLPIQHEKIWRKYQATLEWFWTVYDVYLANDKENMNKTFNLQQRQYILKLLAFMFSAHHTTITKELFMQLMSQVVIIKEAYYYFGSQADSKKTHSLMYSMLLDELCDDDDDKDNHQTTNKDQLISEVLSIPQVRDFIRWSIQNTTSKDKSLAHRLLTLASIQGIIFTCPFVLFNWVQKQHPSTMPGLNHSNDLIWRDEKLNLSFTCMLFGDIDHDLSEMEAHKIIKEAVAHAKSLFTRVLPVSSLGMDCDLMSQFIEHSADRVLADIRFARLYDKEIPFDWVTEPKTETYLNKMPVNNVVDMSASFGEAKFDIEADF